MEYLLGEAQILITLICWYYIIMIIDYTIISSYVKRFILPKRFIDNDLIV